MVAGNLYSEFVVLFRLAHRTRLPKGTADAHESWLERYYQQGIAEGGRVRERLSEGVYQALLTLGSGFLAHPESTKLREAFRHRGRPEERRLLLVPDHENAARQRIYTDWYSITRLRQLAGRRFTGDRHSDLFEGLKQTFLLFRDEQHAAMLGLTALDGELFGPLPAPTSKRPPAGTRISCARCSTSRLSRTRPRAAAGPSRAACAAASTTPASTSRSWARSTRACSSTTPR